MSDTFDLVMTEHPAWQPAASGCQRLFTLPDGKRCLLTVSGGKLAAGRLVDGAGAPTSDIFALSDGICDGVQELATALRRLGSVCRFRNDDLWGAISTAIIRQVIRAGQSKKLYRAFCQAYGERVELASGGTYALFPSAQIVLGLGDEHFSSMGMAFKRRPLRAAAEAYLEHGAKWIELSPSALTYELQIVPRIGTWTAHAAVADWSNDWALYPYADLAVRTWAKRAAPSYDWPRDEATFGRVWRALAGDQLSSLTLLTLAWGSQHGDIG